MNVIIIEKKQKKQDSLCKLIRLFCPNLNIIGCANTSQEGVNLVNSSDPDLIFIDNQILNQKQINLLTETSTSKIQVVFITENDSLIKNNDDITYLLKPIHPDSLNECVDTARQKLRRQLYPEYEKIGHHNKADKFDRIGIPTTNGIKYLALAEIIYLRARDNYTEIIQEKKKTILISRALKSFENLLSGTHFARVHQSYLVNLEKVIELQRIDGGLLILENNHKIPISRSKKDCIKKKLSETWKLI